MKRNLKYLGLVLILFIGLFIITGCNKENKESNEDNKTNLETKLELNQTSDTEFTITIQNGKKGTSEKGSILLSEGEDILEDYSFEGMKECTVYLIPKGKEKEDQLGYDLLSGEGSLTTMDIVPGEYELLLEVDTDGLTGTFTAKTIAKEN